MISLISKPIPSFILLQAPVIKWQTEVVWDETVPYNLLFSRDEFGRVFRGFNFANGSLVMHISII